MKSRARKLKWPPAFLRAFVEFGTVTAACEAAGVARRTVYSLRARDDAFAEAFELAEIAITERLEREGIRRATLPEDGSDRLLEFFLKARRPEVYRERIGLDHGGRIEIPQTPITIVTGGLQPMQLSPEARKQIAAALEIEGAGANGSGNGGGSS